MKLSRFRSDRYASHLLIATGRIPSFKQAQMKFPYIGIKAHFEGIKVKHTL